MEGLRKPSTSLFDVYLRLRPHRNADADRFLDVEDAADQEHGPTHIAITPPTNEHRRRAVEKFAFTRVFDERSTQLDVLGGTTLVPLIEGVLAPATRQGRDGLLATLGVTGSGKSHTILGSRSQRGLTQMSLDILFKSIDSNIAAPADIVRSLAASDVSEAQLTPAASFLDNIYSNGDSRMASRAQTPLLVSKANTNPKHNQGRSEGPLKTWHLMGLNLSPPAQDQNLNSACLFTARAKNVTKTPFSLIKETNANGVYTPSGPSPCKRQAPRVSNLPQKPSVDSIQLSTDSASEYAIVISMYEVYNNKIFDLLNGTTIKAPKTPAHQLRRRELLFKSTEYSPDRKIVAGLRKIICGSLDEALLVLETGLTERRVASTGSNAVSSRSHGFFCVEVKKRAKAGLSDWSSSTMTIVDLAGSERARDAKTAGTTLAEAGKINESLMYLGQCMQMQSDNSIAAADLSATNPKLVPFRQCKLTELLFSNSFKTSPTIKSHQPQKAVMIVTADPHGDFNATSQILRYSALAREVTVPRIPSVTSTIGLSQGSGANSSSSRPTTANSSCGRTSPFATRSCSAESNYSSLTHRLEEEVAVLRVELEEEARRRRAAEEGWARAEQLRDELEAEVRAECWQAFEARLAAEREQWHVAHEEQAERTQRHLDNKLDLLARGLDEVNIFEDDKGALVDQLERDNATLREQLQSMQREKSSMQSPSKKSRSLKGKNWTLEAGSAELGVDENAF